MPEVPDISWYQTELAYRAQSESCYVDEVHRLRKQVEALQSQIDLHRSELETTFEHQGRLIERLMEIAGPEWAGNEILTLQALISKQERHLRGRQLLSLVEDVLSHIPYGVDQFIPGTMRQVTEAINQIEDYLYRELYDPDYRKTKTPGVADESN